MILVAYDDDRPVLRIRATAAGDCAEDLDALVGRLAARHDRVDVDGAPAGGRQKTLEVWE